MTSKKNPQQATITKLEGEYDATVPLAARFGDELAKQLTRVAEDNGIPLGFPIQQRVKQWASIADKLKRLSLRVGKITDIQDLVGLRVILLFKRDVGTFAKLLADHFQVVRQYDTQDRLKEDQFGYSSVHTIVRVPQEWLNVPTLSRMGDLEAEVQIRTVAQHMWAEASHLLQYKQESAVPANVIRSIYRVSALLESVDLEYERILEQRAEYRRRDLSAEVDQPLNVDLLEKVLDSRLPAPNKDVIETYSELMTDLSRCGIATTTGLIALIAQHKRAALEEDRKMARERLAQSEEENADEDSSPARLRRGIFFTHVGLVRTMLDFEFGYKVAENGTQIK